MTNDHSELKYHGSVCISGLTASGKTTHSLLLAGEFGLTFVSGSQVRLFLSGVFPIQQKDFWLTKEGKDLWREEVFRKVEVELLRLEKLSSGYVFDTFTMPWLHQEPALCIWLASDIESRKYKSIVSHRGLSHFPDDSYIDKINEKDFVTIDLYKTLYDIDIGTNLDCFDLVIDISTFINEPSLESSLRSIAKAHKIIRAATGYYLSRSDDFRDLFRSVIEENKDYIVHNSLLA